MGFRARYVLALSVLVVLVSGCTLDAVIFLPSTAAPNSNAPDPDLSTDPGFVNNLLTTNLKNDATYNFDFYPSTMALQGDGKLLVTGAVYGLSEQYFLARHLADGGLDPTFNSQGYLIAELGPDIDESDIEVLQQSDGKIVLVMKSFNQTLQESRVAVVRYNSDGSLDTAFGNSGKVDTLLGVNHYLTIGGAAIQSDGKIVVGGEDNGASSQFYVVRYNPNGTLDTAFGSNGIATAALNSYQHHTVDLQIQSDGKIMVLGQNQTGMMRVVMAVARFNSDGSLDNGFGSNGTLHVDLGGENVTGKFKVLSDGKILIASALRDNASILQVLLVRLNSDGSLDTSFNTTGYVLNNTATDHEVLITSLAVQSDGKIIVASVEPDYAVPRIHRFNGDGTLDAGFHASGLLTNTGFSGNGQFTNGMSIPVVLLLNNGSFIVGAPYSWSSHWGYRAFRFDATSADSSYSMQDIEIGVPVSSGDDASAILSLNDGRFLVAGKASTPSQNFVAVARYLANGKLDLTFNGTGKILVPMSLDLQFVRGLRVQADGKVVVAGDGYGTNGLDLFLFRLSNEGSLDPGFGTAGIVITDIENGSSDGIGDMDVQSDGKILIAGEFYVSDGKAYVLRYNIDGTLDNSFGVGGLVAENITAVYGDRYAKVRSLSGGKILVSGETYTGSGTGFRTVLAQYNSDGSPDTSFNSTGFVLQAFPVEIGVTDMDLQSDGKILITGNTNWDGGGNADFFVARFSSNGSLDTSFNSVGYVRKDWEPGSWDTSYGVRVLPSGKILIAGYAGINDDGDYAIMMLAEDGSFDTSFGVGGFLKQAFPGYTSEYASSVAVTPNGDVLVGGTVSSESSEDFGVFRIQR